MVIENQTRMYTILALLTAGLFVAVGFAPAATAALVATGDPGVTLDGPSVCKTRETNDIYEETCTVKRFDDGSVCVGWYYWYNKNDGTQKGERCYHHVRPNLHPPQDGDAQIAIDPTIGVSVGPELCAWEKTEDFERESCVIKVGRGKVCYNYYYYHRYSDGYTVTRCEMEIDINDIDDLQT